MTEQLSLLDEPIVSSIEEEVDTEKLFEANGRQRCEHCRKRLEPWAGRMYCTNVHCPGTTR